MGKKTMTQVVTRAQHSGQGAAGLHVQLDAHGYDRGSKQLGSVIISWLFQGPFAKVERREDQLEVFLKYARRFGVPEVINPQHPFYFYLFVLVFLFLIKLLFFILFLHIDIIFLFLLPPGVPLRPREGPVLHGRHSEGHSLLGKAGTTGDLLLFIFSFCLWFCKDFLL